MNGKTNSGKQGAGSQSGSSAKGALLLGVVGVGAIIVALAIFNSPSKQNQSDTSAPNSSGPAATTATSPAGEAPQPNSDLGKVHIKESAGTNTLAPKEIVANIVDIAMMTNGISAADAQKFRDGLLELVRQGSASVPAIQGYLDKNTDSNYGQVPGAEQLGYSSLRHALLDTLKQIGGPDAEASMVHVLQTTAEPNEVGELARDLEAQAPGVYREQSLEAAKEALDMAYNGQLGKDIERGPLFRIFQMYGAAYAPPPGIVQSGPEEHEVHNSGTDVPVNATAPNQRP